ncbi:GNAT family N-acetyltransferase [Cellulomonas sp. ES6]|uniref:GNAT family N-acetyltransferase n=1 Tax=Cellulomonas sp. ES6 TaxID=3039384 RepID=UPI0024B816D5|nr:GNAT family N-acetyltransferase [Cellulomonas sp. ES6]WHP16111.1 GNAT family N-acetyltransferase [Cellulomonas sp. ES6]
MPLFAVAAPDAHGRPDPAVAVRAARAADARGIALVAATRGPLPDGFAARVVGWSADPTRHLLLAEREGAVVGWAMLARWDGHDDVPDGLYVSALTVHPDRRRTGAGTRLLAALLERADGDVRSVVNARNTPSLALHARHGFTEAGRAATYAGIEFEGGTGVLLHRRRQEDVT